MSDIRDITIPAFTLGDRLAKARKHAGIGSEQMAGLLGVGRSSISNYEAGRTEPPLHIVLDWAKETNVPLSWIVGAEADTPTSRSDLFFGIVGAAA